MRKNIYIDITKFEKYNNPYLGVYQETVSNPRDFDEMFDAIAIINKMIQKKDNEYLTTGTPFPETEAENIMEAYKFADSCLNDGPEALARIASHWFGHMPLLFNLGKLFVYIKEKAIMESGLQSLSKGKQDLFQNIVNAFVKTNTDIVIVHDGNFSTVNKDIDRQNDTFVYDNLKIITYKFLTSKDTILTLLERDGDIETRSSIRMENGKVFIIGADELEWAYNQGCMIYVPTPCTKFKYKTFEMEQKF